MRHVTCSTRRTVRNRSPRDRHFVGLEEQSRRSCDHRPRRGGCQGYTINGLTIRSEHPALDTYFEREVVGGRGHFVISVDNYDSFASAIARKLLHEITGPGVS